ncbi:hypothetical protein [Ruminococcus sp.]|jgi:hypothetical protein|uniref:hypothetical protein n=1 Tax=Ruminococcus sp. TaxID=41978 RepID=UPI003521AB9B
MDKTLTIGDRQLEVEVTAYTMLIYEDNFKGHSFLKDVDMLTANPNKVQYSSTVRILWAAAKSADDTIKPIKEFSKQYSIGEVISTAQPLVDLIVESLKTSSKKATAAAV